MGRILFGTPIFRLQYRMLSRLRKMAVAAAMVLAVPAVAVAWEGSNVDLPGSDYAAFCTSSAAQCRQLCLSQSRCRAFTWVQVGSLGSTGVPAWLRNCYSGGSYVAACFLKSAVPTPVRRFAYPYTYYSGIKETRIQPRTTPRGCQWGNSLTRPGQRGCFCWDGSVQVERSPYVCQGS